jgi:quercetin dioxygenase-like cupin family protein
MAPGAWSMAIRLRRGLVKAYSVYSVADSHARKIVEDWGSLSWLAGKKLGNAEGLTLGRVVIRKGCCNPRHIHNSCEEVLYLLAGRLEHTMGDEKVVLNAGDTLVVAAGVAHNAVSIGDVDADMIVAYSAGVRDFVLEEE